VGTSALKKILEGVGRVKVEAKKPKADDDGELMLVYAADGTIERLELR
jgi:hypothetical protein